MDVIIVVFFSCKEPEFEVGSSIAVTVLEQRDFGFIVELSPGVSSLLHISQLSRDHVSESTCVHHLSTLSSEMH